MEGGGEEEGGGMSVAREDHRAGRRGVGRVVAAVAGVSGDFLLFVFWAVHLARAPPPSPILVGRWGETRGNETDCEPHPLLLYEDCHSFFDGARTCRVLEGRDEILRPTRCRDRPIGVRRMPHENMIISPACAWHRALI